MESKISVSSLALLVLKHDVVSFMMNVLVAIFENS